MSSIASLSGPLREPSRLSAAFRRLAWSNLAAQSAEQIALAAAPLVAVLLFGAGAGETGLLQTVLTLPFVLFAIPAGLLADRMPRGRLMALAEALRAAALAATLGLLMLGLLTQTTLAGLGFLAVCGTVVFSVAAPSLVPALVHDAALPLANARIELARTIAFAGGPAIGGALVGFTGPATAFGAASLLSVASALLLWRLAEPARPPAPARHPLRDIAEGVRFVFGHALLRPVFLTQVIFNTAFFIVLAVFVPHAVHTLGLGPQGVGLVLATYGIGMVIGALAAPRVMAGLRFGTVTGLGPVCGLAASIVIAATAIWPSPLLAAAGLFLLGVGPILWTISTTTLRQSVTPAALLGRVSAINIMSYGARPLGAAIGAVVGGLSGTGACLWLAVAGFALQAAIILVSPICRLAVRPPTV